MSLTTQCLTPPTTKREGMERLFNVRTPQPVGNCDGFDKFAGQRWIYPNNMTVRGYQKQAVEKALFTNAMIVLPTGFGKTFIAAVVMYNFYRWYPGGKIVFVAPTRPLVAQQILECKRISGIPSSDCIELTGTIHKDKRSLKWSEKRVFFATPQVIENDLEDKTLPAKKIRCIVIDEAHRAQGNYAYVNIIRMLHEDNKDGFRVLALSATPGSDMQRVRQVMLNLYIGDVLFKSENALELSYYRNEKTSRAWTVELTGKHQELMDQLIESARPTLQQLQRAQLVYQNSLDKVAPYMLIMAMKDIDRNNAGHGSRSGLAYLADLAHSHAYAFELLAIYGIRVAHAWIMDRLNNRPRFKSTIEKSAGLQAIMKEAVRMFGDLALPDPDTKPSDGVDLLKGHPKLQVVKDLLFQHFEAHKDKPDTRVMIFTKFRDSVHDIVQTLRQYEPTIKPGAFVGQKSMKQKEQLKLVQEFKAGNYNVLVATCVAEEGLDIGEVDLIICYDTSSSPISNTQRRGRTGRKRSGDVQTLCTKNFEEKRLQKAGSSRRHVEEQLYKRENYMDYRYRGAPRLVPADVTPICFEHQVDPINDEIESESGRPKGRPRKAPATTTTTRTPKTKKGALGEGSSVKKGPAGGGRAKRGAAKQASVKCEPADEDSESTQTYSGFQNALTLDSVDEASNGDDNGDDDNSNFSDLSLQRCTSKGAPPAPEPAAAAATSAASAPAAASAAAAAAATVVVVVDDDDDDDDDNNKDDEIEWEEWDEKLGALPQPKRVKMEDAVISNG